MKKSYYKKLKQISCKRKIIDRSISDELKNEDITELLCFLCYFKCGAGYEDSYTIFRALPRRKFCNDKTLSVEVNNISYDKNVYNMYGIDTFYFSINSFMKKYSDKKRIFRDKEVHFKEATNSLRNLRTINCITFDIDFKDCNALVERFNGDAETIMDYILQTVNSILPVNAIVFSGSGVHLYYNLNNEVISQEINEKKQKILKYKSLCKTIADKFAKYDIICDSHVTGDVCRILRIPYSYNTKTDYYRQSYIYYKNYCEPYDIRDLLKEFNIKNNVNVQDLTSKSNNNDSSNKKINHGGYFTVIENGYTTPNTDESLYTRRTQTKNYAQTVANRLEDIKKFVAIKKEYNGRRTTILSMTAIMLNDVNKKEKLHNGDNAFIYNVEREIDAINGNFSLPLSDKEVDKIKNNYNKYEYKTTNVYWAELLGLTEIDMTYSKEIIDKKEAERRKVITVRRRNKKYYEKNVRDKNKEKTLNKKQEKTENENALVSELINQGKTNKEIADELGCSVRKVQRIKSRINKIRYDKNQV